MTGSWCFLKTMMMQFLIRKGQILNLCVIFDDNLLDIGMRTALIAFNRLVHKLWIIESVDSRLNEIELTLLELEVESKSDYADPIMPMDSNATDLSNLTSSINAFTGWFNEASWELIFFQDELNSLRVSMDEKMDSLKEEMMLQVQEKIDQALTEIDDNTDRSDQIDSVKSNIQGIGKDIFIHSWEWLPF